MKIIVIGGDAAGMSAASKAKRVHEECEIVVYEKSDVVSYAACGLPYYISGAILNSHNLIARTKEQFEEMDINIKLLHEVIGVDTDNKRIKVRNLSTTEEFEDSYDKLMIATGSKAIRPNIKGNNLEGVFTLKTLKDGIELKEYAIKDEVKNIVIIGGGYIGIEVAEAMHELGKNILIIEKSDRILSNYDKEIVDKVMEGLKNQHINIIVDEELKEIKGESKVESVKTNRNEYKADLVFIAIGVVPNTSFLDDIEIKMLSNGAIEVNNKMETSIQDVYSAGDCATVYHRVINKNVYLPLATTANKMGKLAGANMVGENLEFQGTLGSSVIKIFDLQATKTGIGEEEAKKYKFNYDKIFIMGKDHSPYYPNASNIYVKLIYEKDSEIVLGAQLVGRKGCAKRSDVFSCAIHTKMTLHEIGYLDLCYAPPFSTVWDVVNIAGNAKK